MSWAHAVSIEEARRGLIAAPFRTVLTVVVLALAFGLSSRGEMIEHSAALSQDGFELRSGRNVFVATSAGDGNIDGVRCARLNSADGVIAAAPVREVGVFSFDHAPGDLFLLQESTPELAFIVSSGQASSPAWASSNLAQSISLSPGREYATSAGPITISHLVEVGARASSMSAAVTVMGLIGRADSCWVEFRAGSTESARQVLEAALFSPGQSVVVVPVFQVEPHRNAADVFRHRSSRWFFLVAAAATWIIMLAVVGSQRKNYALYRTLGATRANVAALASCEVGLMLAAAVPVSYWLILGTTFGRYKESTEIIGLWTLAKTMAASLACIPICMLVAGLGRTIERIRE